MSKIILKKDLIIPAGTVFKNCDGLNDKFDSDNFEPIHEKVKHGQIYINIEKQTNTDIKLILKINI